MLTQVHKIAKTGHSVIDMAEDAVMKIVPKDGSRFKGNVHALCEDGNLVLCYADGTAVTIANL